MDTRDLPGRCALCLRILSSGELEAMSLCGDCKFLFLEDSERQTRYNSSSESIENMFPNMMNLARHNHSTASEQENPSVSRQWRRVLSDTESDGFESSVYLESDSDASVDVFAHPDAASVVDSDTDIDPMHAAGPNQWNSDELEEVEAVESLVGRVGLRRSLATNGRNLPVDWLSEAEGGAVGIRVSERRQIDIRNLFGSLEDQETSRYVGNAGDYVDARGFEQVLERLAETDSSRCGAPPTAVWFVKNLEGMVVDEEELVCAICKDILCVGSIVNRLPCLHAYHPKCITPWLNAHNTCPLCRYQLPTDDKDYECQEMEEEEDASSEGGDNESGRGRGRGWWFVAAPIVSMVGIGVVVWFQRDNRSRRWWSLF